MDFKKNFYTYDENAIIQKQVAKNLVDFISKKIEGKKFNNVIELGCGTGLFTKEILKKIEIKNIDLNDYYDTENYFIDIKYRDFICKNMSEIKFKKYDLVISSSSFQWIEDLDNLIKNISKNTEKLAFSIYLEDNLKEIYNHFKIGLNYKNYKEVIEILKKYFNNIDYYTEIKSLEFTSPLEVLRHLKRTGVSLGQGVKISEIKSFKEKKLTYSIGYFISYN